MAMVKTLGLTHLALTVSDVNRSFQFYHDVFGMLAVYREPVGKHWHLFALLPSDKVEPTPYQRDLSPTHAKRLQEVVKRIDRFVDPQFRHDPGSDDARKFDVRGVLCRRR
jgi:catechol 2,3-dioxygenase-like lactoylglutathione lyase family enzyme